MDWRTLGVVLVIAGFLIMLFAPRKPRRQPAPQAAPSAQPPVQQARTWLDMPHEEFLRTYDPNWILDPPRGEILVHPPTREFPRGRWLTSCRFCPQMQYLDKIDEHLLNAHDQVRPRRRVA